VGNLRRVRAWDYRRALARLGRPVERTEWWLPASRPAAILIFQQNAYTFAAALAAHRVAPPLAARLELDCDRARRMTGGGLDREMLVERRGACDHLREAGEIRSASDLEDHFTRRFDIAGVTTACEYLSDQGLIVKASSPVRATKRSSESLPELAFFLPEELDGT